MSHTVDHHIGVGEQLLKSLIEQLSVVGFSILVLVFLVRKDVLGL